MAKYTIEDSRIRKWPENCVWPMPLAPGEGERWDSDDVDPFTLDEIGEDLLEFKEYMDKLQDAGRLNSDYSLNPDYDGQIWIPDCGEDYFDEDGFNTIAWQMDFSDHINLLKLPLVSIANSPVIKVREAIDYDFINENILRQAFTRRSFGIEYKTGDYENLEFIGDSILEMVVTRTMADQLTEVYENHTDAPFSSTYDEGELTKIRTHFVNKEYLAKRASELGLDQLILYGTGETESDSAKEDMIEALIGAVAVDSGWNWPVIEKTVDRLVCIQLTKPDRFLKLTYYDLFNAWHQKHFGKIPDYQVDGRESKDRDDCFSCVLRFRIPKNKEGLHASQIVTSRERTRSLARERAAMKAYAFAVNHGLWIRLEDAGLTPSLEDSINQLQELYQKKYVDTKPQYFFEERWEGWHCECICGGVNGYGTGSSKTKAKKEAAYMVLERLLNAAGIRNERNEHDS